MAQAKPTPAATTTATETSPLLPQPNTGRPPSVAHSDVLDDDEPALDPQEARKSLIRWTAFWVVFAIFTTVLVVEAFKEGGGEFDWKGALKKAAGGGISGAAAMVIQVLTLMPLRTMMNYQYRYGGTFFGSYKILQEQGGFPRFYAGLGPALFQGPIARFGDTAANTGILALLKSNPFLSKLPSPLQTAFASLAGAGFRMILVPIDTLKTTMQTQGGESGTTLLRERIKKHGVGTLWYGALATAAASFVGSFPWFATYNFLDEVLPPPHSLITKLLRSAFIGFAASVVSDTVSNSLRVLKTYRQVNRRKVGYRAAAKEIIAAEGWFGLFGRGLGTRLLANGLQGLLFSVLWRLFQDLLAGKKQ
ncbi:mitochondrial carrier [Meredithblackwellia eburnea MCA 4105]